MNEPVAPCSQLRLHDLSYDITEPRGTFRIFESLNWSISPKEAHIIRGVSGSGKSTLLALLSGLQHPTVGSVTHNGIPLTDHTAGQLTHFRNQVVGIVFQQPLLIPELTVAENVATKGLICGHTPSVYHAEAKRLLALVELQSLENQAIHQLSGGEQQRVAIARALYGNPQFLLLDEPTAHLDHENKHAILRTLDAIRHQNMTGIVLTTHDQEVVLDNAQTWLLTKKTITNMNLS